MTDGTQRIVCSAVKHETGLIVAGVRHFDLIMQATMELSNLNWDRAEQGFLDQYGTFLTREEAHVIAHASGQIVRRVGGDSSRLYSENLY